ncbi:MAG: triose-phosphate isomerase [Beutenbergiaceae bacterium]
MTASPSAPASTRQLTAPFFELGPKNLLRLPELLVLARAAQEAGARTGVSVVLSVPAPLIAPAKAAAPGILVFAQAMDSDEPGTTVGTVIAESLADAGADGVLLNHDSNPLAPAAIPRAIDRAHGNGLLTMVCAGDQEQVLTIARLRPTTILFEPPELIGGTGGDSRPWIADIDAQVRRIDPSVLMMHAGGVAAPRDAYQIMRAGAAGTGSTSGVLGADSPARALTQFIEATRDGYADHRSTHP